MHPCRQQLVMQRWCHRSMRMFNLPSYPEILLTKTHICSAGETRTVHEYTSKFVVPSINVQPKQPSTLIEGTKQTSLSVRNVKIIHVHRLQASASWPNLNSTFRKTLCWLIFRFAISPTYAPDNVMLVILRSSLNIVLLYVANRSLEACH